MEDKKDRFIRVGEKRLEKAVRSIELLIPLSDKSRYDYSEKQAKYIVRTLRESVTLVDRSFKGDNIKEKKISIPRE